MANYVAQKESIIPVTLTAGDIEIGAVELKNATTDDRAVVQAASSADATDIALTVADGNLHDSLGAVGAAADVDGVLHGQLRYIGEAVDALPTALGAAAAAASVPVVQCTEDAAKQTAIAAGVFLDISTEGDTLAFDTTAKTGSLTAGKYLICATQDCHVRTMPQATAAATADSAPLPAWTLMGVIVDATNDTIAAIKEGVAGNLYFAKVG